MVDCFIFLATPEKKAQSTRPVTKASVLTSVEQNKLFQEKVEHERVEEREKKQMQEEKRKELRKLKVKKTLLRKRKPQKRKIVSMMKPANQMWRNFNS